MNGADRSYSEKREFLRMQIQTPVEVSVTGDDLSIQGTCLNLSGNGMSITLNKTLPVGTPLEVSIQSPQGDSIMMKAKTEVIRVEGGPEDQCNLGLKIIEVTD